MYPKLDEFDKGILHERQHEFNYSGYAHEIRIGDFVRFPNLDNMRRVSHIWRDEDGKAIDVQTSDGGSYYLGRGYVSMSGSLYRSVPASSIRPVFLEHRQETHDGSAWFFHHDWQEAHNGVYFMMPFRVFVCDQDAPAS